MSVEKTRAEILRLIAKVNETPRAAAHRGELDRQLRARKQKLERLREQRDRIASTLARTPLVDRVGRIEKRLDRVEQKLTGGATPAAGAPASTVPPDAVFGGQIRETMLGDMLQLVTSQGMSGVFGVSDGGREIMLYFHEGEIHHASGADTEGEDAVFAAMAIQVGSYYFRETTELPDDRTINANTQFLILEALRRIDEESAGATP